jgi:hypothetical protein
MRGRANLDLTFEAFEFVGLSGGTSLASVPSYEKKGLCSIPGRQSMDFASEKDISSERADPAAA